MSFILSLHAVYTLSQTHSVFSSSFLLLLYLVNHSDVNTNLQITTKMYARKYHSHAEGRGELTASICSLLSLRRLIASLWSGNHTAVSPLTNLSLSCCQSICTSLTSIRLTSLYTPSCSFSSLYPSLTSSLVSSLEVAS